METDKCCDNCKWFEWYWDKCKKWDCECDFREVHSCYEPIERGSNNEERHEKQKETDRKTPKA
jgi:hypothetical protein